MCMTASVALKSTKEDAPGADAAGSARPPAPLASASAAWVKTRRDHLATIAQIRGRNSSRLIFDNLQRIHGTRESTTLRRRWHDCSILGQYSPNGFSGR